MELNVLSIDIGILNLGYVFAKLKFDSENYSNPIKNNLDIFSHKDIEVIACDRVNITHMKHNTVEFCNCKLHHESCVPDYLDHFIQENEHFFTFADLILLERQPPVGIVNVQDLLFTKFRNKVTLISPCSVHKYFRMSKNYDTRKNQSELISSKYLSFQNKYNNNTRRHDMSDAMLMLLYYYKIHSDELFKNKPDTITDFEQFRL